MNTEFPAAKGAKGARKTLKNTEKDSKKICIGFTQFRLALLFNFIFSKFHSKLSPFNAYVLGIDLNFVFFVFLQRPSRTFSALRGRKLGN